MTSNKGWPDLIGNFLQREDTALTAYLGKTKYSFRICYQKSLVETMIILTLSHTDLKEYMITILRHPEQ